MFWNYFAARKFNFGLFCILIFSWHFIFQEWEKEILTKKSNCKKAAKIKISSSKIIPNHQFSKRTRWNYHQDINPVIIISMD